MQEKRKNKRVTTNDMMIPGAALAVKVIGGNLEPALRLFKKKMKDSGKLEELKARKEFLKPSVIKRRKMQLAKRVQWRKDNPDI